jgi:PKHD-type hydroxylase
VEKLNYMRKKMKSDNAPIKDISELIKNITSGQLKPMEETPVEKKKIMKWDNVPAADILKKNENHQDAVVLPKIFTPEECDDIIKTAGVRFKKAQTRNSVDRISADNPSVRKTDLIWIDISKPKFNWIYERITLYVEQYNDAVWGYDVAEPYLIQGFQLGKYSKGSFYDWHTDSFAGELSTRRLSMTVQLTNPDEYEGGDFEMFRGNRGDSYPEEINHQGSVILFPSYIWHRVHPITKGTRFSLVGWVLGNAMV